MSSQTMCLQANYHEVRASLDEEPRRLIAQLQEPLVLGGLQGRTKSQAAHGLGWNDGAVSSRLAVVQSQMLQSGLALPAGGLAAVLAPKTLAQAVAGEVIQVVPAPLSSGSDPLVGGGAQAIVALAGSRPRLRIILALVLMVNGGVCDLV